MSSLAPKAGPPPICDPVFISYARDDATVALSIATVLRQHGIEVWFDQKELAGGAAWDATIRQQIKGCALFLALVSRNTNARLEGYFRREWKLALDRMQDMAAEKAFLLPVVIDGLAPEEMRVPERFFEVQWFPLPEGVGNEALARRVRALLEGTASGMTNTPFKNRRVPVAGGSAMDATVPTTTRRRHHRAWRLGFGLALALGGGLAVVKFWPEEPRREPTKVASPKAAPPAAKPKVAAAPRLSEAGQLVVKASELWEKADEATRADWALADELCKRAVGLEPANGEAWAMYSHVAFGLHEYSQLAGARDLARERAERAVRLLPASKSARLALANAYRTNFRTLPEAERLLRQLAAATPDDKRVLRRLGDALRDRRKYLEALAFYEQATALPGGDPLALLAKSFTLELLGRYDEAESAVDESLALRRGPAAMLRKVDCRLNFHGDLDGAAKMLARVPATASLDDRAVSLACQLWLWRRQPDKCLDLLNGFPRDFLNGYYWPGAPKRWLLGKVHLFGGRQAAAEAQWGMALKAVEKARAENPGAVDLIYWSAHLHVRLGDKAEAERQLDLADQLSAGGVGRNLAHVAAIKLLLGHKHEVLDSLESRLKTSAGPALRNELRFDPAFDGLRGDPRFEAMLAAPR